MGFTAKVQLTDVRPYGEGDARSVALSFIPDYRDGRNADWAHNTPGLSLSMTVRGDVADRLGLATGQEFTLTFDRDGEEQGVVAPAASTEVEEPKDFPVPDLNGGTVLVTRTEAARLGYDTAGGAAQGLGAGPVGAQPSPVPADDTAPHGGDDTAPGDDDTAPADETPRNAE